jgi:predicted small lipoprotein YifL
MRPMRTSLGLVALISVASLFALAGCSAKGDLEKICNADKLSGVASDDPQRLQKIAVWLDKNVSSSDGKSVLKALEYVASDEKGAILRKGAQEVGYTGPCPFADTVK